MQYKDLSCGLTDKEFVEIVNLENSYNESTDGQNQNQTQPDIDFTGKYRMTKSENFDKFLEELGVGFLQRTLANRAKPDYEITKNGDYYTLKTISQFKTSEITFKFGEQFEENRLDGERVKSTIVQKGNKWVQNQVSDNNKVVKVVREFNGDSITVTGVVNNVVFVRVYERVTD